MYFVRIIVLMYKGNIGNKKEYTHNSNKERVSKIKIREPCEKYS